MPTSGLARRVAGRLFGVLLTALALAAPVATLYWMQQVEVDPTSGSTPKWETAARMAPTVQLVSPRWIRDDRPIPVSGTIRAWQEVRLSFLASGHVERIGADLGDRVEKGQELARLDRTQFLAALEEAKAGLAHAEWEWSRVAGLAEKDLAAGAEIAARKAALEAGRAAVKRAEHMYEGGLLKAPTAGRIAARMIEVGQFVAPSQPAFLLVELDRVKLVVGATEHQLARLAPNDTVTFRVDSYPDRVFSGKVDRLGVYTPQASGTFEVEIAAENETGLLKPGMVASAEIRAHVSPKRMVLPVDAVRFQGDQATVFFHDAVTGSVEQRVVQTGDLTPEGITIRSGLSEADRVVMRPGVSLFSGQQVAVMGGESGKSTRAVAETPAETAGPLPEKVEETARR